MVETKMEFYILVLCFMVLINVTNGWYDTWVYPLNGKDWVMTNAEKTTNISATVPGNSYTALMHSGKLKDPYYRFNDRDYKWVAKENWTFTKYIDFSRLQDGFTRGNIDLVFYGLDTVATIKLNGHILGKTSNMFHRYIYHVQDYLKNDKNILEVAFQSPLAAAAEKAKTYPYTVPPTCPPTVQNGDCYVNFLRKEQASFSWDWGPSFPTVGIWKDVVLHGYNSAIISQVTAQTKPVKLGDYSGDWLLSGTVYFDVGKNQTRQITGELVFEGGDSNNFQMVTISAKNNAVNYSFTIDGETIKLWWPNGHGSRSLYDFSVNFTSAEYGSEQSLYMLQIAYRTVELIQEPVLGSPGLSFYFRVNGKPIFMKGSNWIPADSFQDRITEEYLTILLSSAVEANMNMLRVWGGGVYESDAFYRLANELGILIWQDMMFACALYPTDDTFIESVTEEVTYQIRRLKHHPSIAIWAGNNENEGALMAPWWNLSAPFSTYKKDYIKLYVDTIRTIVMSEDDSRPFVTSSPSNGKETEKEGWLAKDVYDPHYGDVHYYNYSADGWNYKTNPIPRFASEYGVQSWCSIEALKAVSEPGDLQIDSKFAMHRQHHEYGNKQMQSELEVHLTMPMSSDPNVLFEDFVYLTQINQAVSIKTESEHYLRMQSMVRNGEGMTMGALYWQLNDIWQAPTWASTEFGGKWKMLHYYAKQFFKPVILSPYINNETVHLQLINSSLPSMPHLKMKNPIKVSSKPNQMTYNNKEDQNYDKVDGDTFRFKPVFGKASNGYSRMKRSLEDGVLHVLEPDASYCVVEGPMIVTVKMYKWSSMEPLMSWNVTFKEPLVASTEIWKKRVSDILKEGHCESVDECFLDFTIQGCDVSNWLLLGYFKTAKGLCQSKDNVQITSVTGPHPMGIEITLSTNQMMPFVWLEARGHKGHFSDNGFMMINKTVTLMFNPWTPVKVEDFQKSLTVIALCDIYNRS